MSLERIFLTSLILFVAVHAADKKQAKLVRQYGQTFTRILDMTSDGRWLLTEGCIGDAKSPCRERRLSVIETRTGGPVDKLSIPGPVSFFSAAGFLPDKSIQILQSGALRRRRASIWSPSVGQSSEFEVEANVGRSCVEGEGRFSAFVSSGKEQRLGIIDQSGTRLLDHQATENVDFSCSWRRGNTYLLPAMGNALTWVSIEQSPLRSCAVFAPEAVYSHTISQDGTLIAVITGTFNRDRVPEHLVYLNLLVAEDCRALKREQLRFPKPSRKNFKGEQTDVLFAKQLARNVAISPDNQLLAISYGMLERPNGQAYFGVYSIATGDLLETLKGDRYTCGLPKAFLSDQLVCDSAPINGPIRFSSDSRTLYTSSDHVQQWDISAVH